MNNSSTFCAKLLGRQAANFGYLNSPLPIPVPIAVLCSLSAPNNPCGSNVTARNDFSAKNRGTVHSFIKTSSWLQSALFSICNACSMKGSNMYIVFNEILK